MFNPILNYLLYVQILLAANTLLSLPKIDLDSFDKDKMLDVLKNYGTFELVGPSIDRLAEQAQNALEKTKEVLSLPLASLEKVKQVGFHGFQNVRQETFDKQTAKIRAGEDINAFPIRNQIAYHYKPYKEAELTREESRIPAGADGEPVNVEAFEKYYVDGMNVLHRLYQEIANNFIDPSKTSNLENDTQSVLTTRRYFTGIEGETGIPAHSDYGLLTLVVSDQPGLEVQHCEKWLTASCSPKLRFYINIGDWLLFQTGREDFKVGIHRVPEVKNERFSMALFLNPPLAEEQETPKGGRVPYQKFLFSDKTPYK